jgi:tetratricopeptide (TPR) repeat protein
LSLDRQLSALEAADLIRKAQQQPELEYLFRHALVQDVAYNSLLRNNRRELHLAVGLLLEQQGEGRGFENAAVLAHHFVQAGDDTRALRYLDTAADAAAHKHASAEAILHHRRALEIAQRDKAGGEARTGSLFLRRGRAFELSGRYGEALTNYSAIAECAHASGDRAEELSALLSSATLYATPNSVYDPSRGEALAQRVVADARVLGEQAIECRALWILMVLNIFASGDPQHSVAYGEQALSLARLLGLREQLAYILTDLYMGYFAVGEPHLALGALAEPRTLWRELGNLPMLADSLSRTAHSYFCAGNFEQCLAFADETLRVSRASHNIWQEASGRQIAAYAYLDQGRIGEAMASMRQMIAAADQGGMVPAAVGGRGDLGVTMAWLGNSEEGHAFAADALYCSEQMPPMRPWALATQARILVAEGNIEEAGALAEHLRLGYAELRRGLAVLVPAWAEIGLAVGEVALAEQKYAQAIAGMDELLRSLQSLGIRPFTYDALFRKGKAFLEQGRLDEAETSLDEASAAAEAVGARRSLWKMRAALGEIKSRRGQYAAAQALNEEARSHIEFIADSLPSDTLRQSFLQTPAVRAVLEPV